MVVEVLSVDFPEILLAIAEENFLRGYEQALVDYEEVSRELRKENGDAAEA